MARGKGPRSPKAPTPNASQQATTLCLVSALAVEVSCILFGLLMG